MNANNTIRITLSVVHCAPYRFSRIHETLQSHLFIVVVIILHTTESHTTIAITSQAYILAQRAEIKG